MKIAFITLALMLIAESAHADFVVFTDKGGFITSTGAVDATGPLPETGFIGQIGGSPPGPITMVGSVNYQAVRYLFTDWTTRVPGNELAISFGADGGILENLNIIATSPVTAMGFDFVEPQNDPNVNAAFVDSTFMVNVKNGQSSLFSFTFNAPNDAAAFIGVAGDTIFDRLEVREIIGGDENEFFGRVYVRIAAVPEPSSMTLLVLATLSSLLWSRSSKRKRRGAD